MFIPVLVFLIMLGAFSAEKLLLCSTSTPLFNIRKQMRLRLSQKRQEKLEHNSQEKKQEQTNKIGSRKERKKDREFTSRRGRNICLKLLCFAFYIKPFPDHLH